MKIKIDSDSGRFTIPIPNCLLLNPVTAAICKSFINGHLSKGGVEVSTEHLTYFEIMRLFREIKKCRRYLKGEPLIYACSSNGDVVEIFL